MNGDHGPQNRPITGRGRGQFPRGKSGNPGGRPKLPSDYLDAVRRAAPDAVSVIVELMSSKRTPPAVRLRAAETLLIRAYGQPLSAAEIPDLKHELDKRAPSLTEQLMRRNW